MGIYNDGMNYNMNVQPAGYGYGYGGYGGDMLGLGGGSWLILFLLLTMCGFGGWGRGGMGMMGGMGNMVMWPWLMTQNTDNIVQGSANQQAIVNGLNTIQQNQQTAEVANCNRAMDNMRTSYENQIASLERSFAAQTAVDGRLDSLSRDLDHCCCDNKLATESLRADILRENCQDRYESQNSARDIIQAINQNAQTIRDDIHKVVDDQKDTRIRELENRLYMSDLATSRNKMTAQIEASQVAQTNQLIQRIAPYPVPSWPVNPPYGYNQGYNWGSCPNNGGYNGGYAFGY